MLTREDLVKIIMRLGLSVDDFEAVKAKVEEIEQKSDLISQKVAFDLETLDTLEVQLNQVSATPNFTMTRADVLEYNPDKQKSYGILSEMLRLCQRIEQLLGIAGNLSYLDEQLELMGAPPVQSAIVGRISRS